MIKLNTNEKREKAREGSRKLREKKRALGLKQHAIYCTNKQFLFIQNYLDEQNAHLDEKFTNSGNYRRELTQEKNESKLNNS